MIDMFDNFRIRIYRQDIRKLSIDWKDWLYPVEVERQLDLMMTMIEKKEVVESNLMFEQLSNQNRQNLFSII